MLSSHDVAMDVSILVNVQIHVGRYTLTGGKIDLPPVSRLLGARKRTRTADLLRVKQAL